MSRRGPWSAVVLAFLLVLAVAPVAAQDEAVGSPEPSSTSTAADPGYDPFALIPIDVEADDDPLDKLGQDPVGNGVAILVLLLLLASLVAAPVLAMRGTLPAVPDPIVLLLALAGMAVAAYLATVETSGAEAICGPVGDCNAVQESEYARVFGIHVGVVGLLGYGLIVLLWLVARVASGPVPDVARVLIAVGTLFGVAFSAYLTFLEPFVIGATCMWCISSAVIMTLLLWVTAADGWAAFRRIRGSGPGDGQHASGRASASAATGH